ncbi:MAG: hypothetical protein AAGF11_47865 [Myxococcota bacterium]
MSRIGRASKIALLGVGMGLMMGAACRPKPSSNPPLCRFKASDEDLATQQLTPDKWLSVISPSVDRSTMTRKGPLKDACGRVLEVPADPWPACPGMAPPTVPKGGDRIEISDLIVGQVGEGRLLIWAATEELATGEAMGPAALVFWKGGGLEVHAAGILRGLREEARIRLHKTSGKLVVILESQQCASDGRCTAITKFFPIVRRRFQDFPIKGPEGECEGEASFVLSRKTEEPRSGKLTRRFELQRTVELAEDGIYLVDLVTGDEYNPRDPVGTVRPFRRVTARRKLELADDHFMVRSRDLWNDVLRDFGLVSPTGQDGPRMDADAEELEGDEGGEDDEGKSKGGKSKKK